jgi:hypothetical protein
MSVGSEACYATQCLEDLSGETLERLILDSALSQGRQGLGQIIRLTAMVTWRSCILHLATDEAP